jgi:hypothetical protein
LLSDSSNSRPGHGVAIADDELDQGLQSASPPLDFRAKFV